MQAQCLGPPHLFQSGRLPRALTLLQEAVRKLPEEPKCSMTLPNLPTVLVASPRAEEAARHVSQPCAERNPTGAMAFTSGQSPAFSGN